MNKKTNNDFQKSDHYRVAKEFLPQATDKIQSLNEYDEFYNTRDIFVKKVNDLGTIPHDPKFNSVLWGYDLINLSYEIIHSYVWMDSWANYFKATVPEGTQPSNSFGQLSFYSSSCITLIDSIRDKIALMVWAYYCPFNPDKRDEVLVYEKVLERLEYPFKFGLALSHHEGFLEQLKKLKGSNFKEVEGFRHLKIHRREPQIELYEPGPHQEIENCLPITSSSMMNEWENSLKEQYPSDPDMRKMITQQCQIDGVLYGSFKPKKLTWKYDTLEEHIFNCIRLVFEASANCLSILSSKPPLHSS